MLAEWQALQQDVWELCAEARHVGSSARCALDDFASGRRRAAQLGHALRRLRRGGSSGDPLASSIEACGDVLDLEDAVGRDVAEAWADFFGELVKCPDAITALAAAFGGRDGASLSTSAKSSALDILAQVAANLVEDPLRPMGQRADLLQRFLGLGEGPGVSNETLAACVPSDGSFQAHLLKALTVDSLACSSWVRGPLLLEVREATARLIRVSGPAQPPASGADGASVGRPHTVRGPGDAEMRTLSMSRCRASSESLLHGQRSVGSFLGDHAAVPMGPFGGDPNKADDCRRRAVTPPPGAANSAAAQIGRPGFMDALPVAAAAVVSALCNHSVAAPVSVCLLAAVLHGVHGGDPAVLGSLLLDRWLAPALLEADMGAFSSQPCARSALTNLAKLLRAIASDAEVAWGGAQPDFVHKEAMRLQSSFFKVLVARGEEHLGRVQGNAGGAAKAWRQAKSDNDDPDWASCSVLRLSDLQGFLLAVASCPASLTAVAEVHGAAPISGALRVLLQTASIDDGRGREAQAVTCWWHRGGLPAPLQMHPFNLFLGNGSPPPGGKRGRARTTSSMRSSLPVSWDDDTPPASGFGQRGVCGDAGGTGAGAEVELMSLAEERPARNPPAPELHRQVNAALSTEGVPQIQGDAGGTIITPASNLGGSDRGGTWEGAVGVAGAAPQRAAVGGGTHIGGSNAGSTASCSAGAAPRINGLDINDAVSMLWQLLTEPRQLDGPAHASLREALVSLSLQAGGVGLVLPHVLRMELLSDWLRHAEALPDGTSSHCREVQLLRMARSTEADERAAILRGRASLRKVWVAQNMVKQQCVEACQALRQTARQATERHCAACLQYLWSSGGRGRAPCGTAMSQDATACTYRDQSQPAAGAFGASGPTSRSSITPEPVAICIYSLATSSRQQTQPTRGNWLSSLLGRGGHQDSAPHFAPGGARVHCPPAHPDPNYLIAAPHSSNSSPQRRHGGQHPPRGFQLRLVETSHCPCRSVAQVGTRVGLEQLPLERGTWHRRARGLRHVLLAMDQLPLETALEDDSFGLIGVVHSLVEIVSARLLWYVSTGGDRAPFDHGEKSNIDGGPSLAALLAPDERHVRECGARLLYGHLHGRLFPGVPTDADLQTAGSIARLAWLKPRHLDVPEAFAETPQAERTITSLRNLHVLRCPGDMLAALARCFSAVTEAACMHDQLRRSASGTLDSFSGGGDAFGADASLPLFILIILRANPPMFNSVLLYAERFSPRAERLTEQGYALTQAKAAVSFITSARRSDFQGLELGEWERHVSCSDATQRSSR